MLTTSTDSTAIDSAASTCYSASLLGSKASADELDTNANVAEDLDCHFENKADEEQSELSEPNDCLAALSYDIREIVVSVNPWKKLA